MYKIKWIFQDLKYGFKNLFAYFSVIWKDRNWDFGYTENLLIIKYKQLYKCLYSDEYLVPVDRDTYVKALKIAINILERRRDSFYTEIWNSEDTTHIRIIYEIENRDWNIYCDIVKKYHNHWWN